VNPETVKTLVDLGGQAVLLFILYQVWQRLNTVTDKLIEITNELRIQSLHQQYAAKEPRGKSDAA